MFCLLRIQVISNSQPSLPVVQLSLDWNLYCVVIAVVQKAKQTTLLILLIFRLFTFVTAFIKTSKLAWDDGRMQLSSVYLEVIFHIFTKLQSFWQGVHWKRIVVTIRRSFHQLSIVLLSALHHIFYCSFPEGIKYCCRTNIAKLTTSYDQYSWLQFFFFFFKRIPIPIDPPQVICDFSFLWIVWWNRMVRWFLVNCDCICLFQPLQCHICQTVHWRRCFWQNIVQAQSCLLTF